MLHRKTETTITNAKKLCLIEPSPLLKKELQPQKERNLKAKTKGPEPSGLKLHEPALR